MVRYFYAWTPFVLIGTLCILALPWLGLIAVMLIALAALAAAAGAFVVLPYLLVRAIGRHLHGTQDATPVEAAPALTAGEEFEVVVRDGDNAYAAA